MAERCVHQRLDRPCEQRPIRNEYVIEMFSCQISAQHISDRQDPDLAAADEWATNSLAFKWIKLRLEFRKGR